MAKITVYTTPTSITIYDGNKNSLMVRKVEDDIEFHSSIDGTRHSKNILMLQNLIRERITKRSKDNYKARFDKLKTFFNGIDTHSFVTLKNKLTCVEH